MELTLQTWHLFPISILIATTAMASGIGGAIFFSPLFILGFKLEPSVAIGTALTTELFGFTSGVYAYWSRRLIDFRWGWALLKFSVPAALIGSVAADHVSGTLLKAVFGAGVIVIGYELYRSVLLEYRESLERSEGGRPEPVHESTLTDRMGRTFRYTVCHKPMARASAAVGGTLLGMISVGLAELLEYHLMARCRIPPPVAVGTSIFVVVVSVLIASLGHFYNFLTAADAAVLDRVLDVVKFTVPGVLIGGQLGPLVQARVRPDIVKRAIAILFVGVGGFMLATLR